jgi:hypothetical protein
MFELPIIMRFSTGLVSSVLDSGHPVDEYVLSVHCDPPLGMGFQNHITLGGSQSEQDSLAAASYALCAVLPRLDADRPHLRVVLQLVLRPLGIFLLCYRGSSHFCAAALAVHTYLPVHTLAVQVDDVIRSAIICVA